MYVEMVTELCPPPLPPTNTAIFVLPYSATGTL